MLNEADLCPNNFFLLGLEEAEKRKEFFSCLETDFFKPFQTESYEPFSFL